MSIYAASETNGLAVGSWPGVCDDIGLVLVGSEGRIQVQAGSHVEPVALRERDVPHP